MNELISIISGEAIPMSIIMLGWGFAEMVIFQVMLSRGKKQREKIRNHHT